MKTTPFTPFTGRFSYAEAVRGKVTMGIMNSKGQELCGRMHCKDFIQDAFLSERTGKRGGIWGFGWDPGQIDPLAPVQQLSLTYLDEGLLGRAKKNLEPFMNAWEEKLGFTPPSMVALAEGEKATLVIFYPKGWTLQPIRFGALTLLLRAATGWDGAQDPLAYMQDLAGGKVPSKDLCFTTDPGYVKKCLDRFERLWKEGEKGWETQTWEQYVAKDGHLLTSDLHHGSGMVSYLRERTP